MHVNRMLWLRHRWLYALVLAFAIVTSGLGVMRTQWNYQIALGNAQALATKEVHGTPQFDEEKFNKHARESVIVYKVNRAGELPVNWQSGEPVTGYFLLAVAALLGVALVAWDRISHFERFLFASRFSRKQVYLRRLAQGLTMMLLTTTVFLGVQFAGLSLTIPAQYLNLSVTSMLQVWLYNCGADAFLFIIGSVFAVMFGQVIVTLVLGLVGFISLKTLPGTYNSFIAVFVLGDYPNDTNLYYAFSLRSPGTIWPWFLVGMLVLGALLIWIGATFYQRVSAENTHRILTVPSMKIPLIVLYALLVGVNGANVYGEGKTLQMFSQMLLAGALTGLAVWVLFSYDNLRTKWLDWRNGKAKMLIATRK